MDKKYPYLSFKSEKSKNVPLLLVFFHFSLEKGTKNEKIFLEIQLSFIADN